MRTVALLLLAACDGGPPRADFHLAPTPAHVDVGDEPLGVQFEAAWTDEAGRRAEIVDCSLHVTVRSVSRPPVPYEVIVTVTGSEGEVVEATVTGGIDRERLAAVWTADRCDGSAQIAFGGHEEPFDVEVSGFAFVEFADWDDYDALDGAVTLSGP